jgi:nitrite reductase/ring-hydroxylating ferredoxin subunit
LSGRTRHRVCSAEDLPPGERLIVDLDGRSVGVFNVDGRFVALHNRCPHQGAELCRGVVSGAPLPTQGLEYEYARAGLVLRCPWHQWEFDLENGRSLFSDRIRAKTFAVTVEDGDVVVHV